jgi:hypothetical protein
MTRGRVRVTDKLMRVNCAMVILMRAELEDAHEGRGEPARIKPKVGLPPLVELVPCENCGRPSAFLVCSMECGDERAAFLRGVYRKAERSDNCACDDGRPWDCEEHE